jgi:Tfp pilus assembly protein PilE
MNSKKMLNNLAILGTLSNIAVPSYAFLKQTSLSEIAAVRTAIVRPRVKSSLFYASYVSRTVGVAFPQ